MSSSQPHLKKAHRVVAQLPGLCDTGSAFPPGRHHAEVLELTAGTVRQHGSETPKSAGFRHEKFLAA